jgi:GNAT superfamily N-acetyltransferase
MSAPYRFERVSARNLADLLPIFESAFGSRPSFEKLAVKFDTTAFGAYTIGYIAYSTENNEPAGYYGVFPIRIRLNGNRVLAAQSGDTMTHKNHQGKGLFTTLARMTYEAAKEEGVALVFGFPNKNSAPGFFKKLNWQPLDQLNQHKIKIPTVPLSALANKAPWLQNIYDTFLPKQEPATENSVLESGLYGVIHDSEFWEYKCRINKLFTIRTSSALFVAKVEKNLFIGDVKLSDTSDPKNTLRELIYFARMHGCHALFASGSPGTPLPLFFNASYEPQKGLEVGYLPLNIDSLDTTRFRFTMADSDTF